ncbi:MAG: nitroreductase family protein [Roseinatronobacter sp.]
MQTTPQIPDFLLTRRSRPVKLLHAPAPDRDAVLALLTAAARVPDHGKLEPWRFHVLTTPAELVPVIAARCAQAELEPDAAAKATSPFVESPLAVVVIASPKPSSRIPEIEQTLSVGAVCLSLVNAALASGWGACWLSGFAAYDPGVKAHLGLAPQEWIAGFVHIGTCDTRPPERPRPDVAALTRWQP